MNRIYAICLACAGVFAGPVLAQDDNIISANWTCSFTKECFEQEACAETAYEVAVTYEISSLVDKPGQGAGSGEIVDQTATRQAVIVHDNGAFVANAVDFSSDATISPEIFQLFASDSGEARLISAIPTEPLLITYYGQCKAEAP